MKENKVLPLERHGYDFIPAEYLPQGNDEYWLRNVQQIKLLSEKQEYGKIDLQKYWRHLKPEETEILIKNRNYCQNWKDFLVHDPFNPELIRDSCFFGLVRIGALNSVIIKHNDFSIPAGIRSSTIISCDIGDDTAIQNCAYISNYIIGDNCILSNIDEIQTTNHAKFGSGVIKDGEDEEVRVWIDVMNEAGGRSILPFEDMIAADAYLWAAYRDDTAMTEKLAEITQKQYGGFRGKYGIIGSDSVIKSCAIIKDTMIGECAYIKGANKLKNITIQSSAEERTQIGEGVEMVNGIVGYACNVFYGCKAVRFVMGRNSNLKYGARLIHSVLGDNSTVSCCELLNNLIFPVHEQHHNNSFLVASLIEGISNMAAAATIGSNHNSRANDGEIRAKRGFWPGLAVSLKHSSKFASFVIIAKGEYPSELNIPLPFSLVNNNVHKNRLEVMPAYFWIHNLYALERNSWKVKNRDRRKTKIQRIEPDYLAPDTAEEIIAALSLLDGWLGEAGYSSNDMSSMDGGMVSVILCRHFEHSKRGQVIIKPLEAIAAYRQMLHYYAVKTIALFLDSHPGMDYNSLCGLLNISGSGTLQDRVKDWVNAGGQIVPAFRVDELRKDIAKGVYKNWEEIHRVYDQWDEAYPLDRCRHAWASLAVLRYTDKIPDITTFKKELTAALETRKWIDSQIYETRAKDYRNQFKKATFRNQAEMEQVLGKVNNNSFIRLIRKEGAAFNEMIERVIAHL
jgi:NDP-sugar pyrophosphorylase family protein